MVEPTHPHAGHIEVVGGKGAFVDEPLLFPLPPGSNGPADGSRLLLEVRNRVGVRGCMREDALIGGGELDISSKGALGPTSTELWRIRVPYLKT